MLKQAALWLWRFVLARLGYVKVPTPTLLRVVVVEQRDDGTWHIGIGSADGSPVAGTVDLMDWQAETLLGLLEQTRST